MKALFYKSGIYCTLPAIGSVNVH